MAGHSVRMSDCTFKRERVIMRAGWRARGKGQAVPPGSFSLDRSLLQAREESGFDSPSPPDLLRFLATLCALPRVPTCLSASVVGRIMLYLKMRRVLIDLLLTDSRHRRRFWRWRPYGVRKPKEYPTIHRGADRHVRSAAAL